MRERSGREVEAAGSLRGTVTGAFGTRVSHAQVAVMAERCAQMAITDRAGHFVIRDLAPGVYRMCVRSAGFARLERSDVRIGMGRETTVDISLTVAFPGYQCD